MVAGVLAVSRREWSWGVGELGEDSHTRSSLKTLLFCYFVESYVLSFCVKQLIGWGEVGITFY